MPASDEKLRQFDILLKNFQNIGKSQSFYVNTLVAFLFLVWTVDILNQAGGVTLSILGASVQIVGLWQIVPLVSGLLVLCLAGSMNMIAHAWRRLSLCLLEVCEEDDFFWFELDANKNILDYLGFLTLRLKKPVLPDTTEAAKIRRTSWRIPDLLYPALIWCSIGTTLASLTHLHWTRRFLVYVIASMLSQLVFSLPFMFRTFRTFFGLHKHREELDLDWGTDALYRMPLSTLKRVVEKSNAPQG
jgi:hypothetical protein